MNSLWRALLASTLCAALASCGLLVALTQGDPEETPDAAAAPDGARADAATADTARPDSMHPDAVHPDAARPDAARPDSMHPDSARDAVTQLEAGPIDVAGSDAGVSDAGVSDAGSCAFPLIERDAACRAARVLLLDDGNAIDTGIATALLDAGMVVVAGGRYFDWDGVTPSLQDVDTILVLQGYISDRDLTTSGQEKVLAFVEGGGGLVRTEWAAWRSSTTDHTTDLLPVVSIGGWATGIDWQAQDEPHPLTTGLPSTFRSEASYTFVSLRPSAAAVISSAHGYPVASYTLEHSGTVVHLNHDVTFTIAMEPAALTLYVNAVYFSALP